MGGGGGKEIGSSHHYSVRPATAGNSWAAPEDEQPDAVLHYVTAKFKVHHAGSAARLPVSPTTRRKMPDAAKARYAKNNTLAIAPNSQIALSQAMAAKLGLPATNETIKQVVDQFVPELSAPYVYAVVRLYTAAFRKKLDEILAKASTGDPSKIKALALQLEIVKVEVTLAKDLGLLEDNGNTEKRIKQIVEAVVKNVPAEYQAQVFADVRREIAAQGIAA